METLSVDEAKQHLDAVIERVLASAEPAVVQTASGQRVVLIPQDEFDAWQETAYLLSDPANAEHLRRSIAEARAGTIIEQDLIEP